MKRTLKCFGLAITCLLVLVGSAGAGTMIFSSGFETPVVGNSAYTNWAVYSNVDGWDLLSGQGIEIQTSGTVAVAHSGNQYIELDSDPNRHVGTSGFGSGTNNSIMGRTMDLTAGNYTLNFYYQPRTDVAGDNGIQFGWWDDSSSSINSELGSISLTKTEQHDWLLVSTSFNIAAAGNYTLAFAATGTSNKLGGFIDDVKLDAVPIPGAIWLLGSGLLGLVGIRRRNS
jgi:hypothetical protein